MDSAIPDIPVLVTHGIQLFLLVLLGWGVLVGSYFGRKWAMARKRRSIANALSEMGGEAAISKEPLWAATNHAHDFVVLEGTLEGSLVQKMGGANRSFPAQRQGRYALIRGGERIDLTGEANILAGSFERFRLVDGRGIFSICERHLVSGDHVIIKGKLKEVDRCVDEDENVTYRTASKRRFALAPATGRDELLIATPSSCKKTTRAKLTVAATLPFAALAAFLFGGVHWVGAKFATNHALEIARHANGDLAKARRTMTWASIGATSIDDRHWALNAITLATSMQSVTDPAAQSDYALLSARFHRFRYHSCNEPLDILQARGHDPTTIRIAEDCGDIESAYVAAQAHMRTGDFWPASVLLENTRPHGERRTKEQLFLEYRAHLLAGRHIFAMYALNQLAYRSAEFFGGEPRDVWRDIQHWLPCIEHMFGARFSESRERREEEEENLANIIMDRASTEEARGVCSILLADLKEGVVRDSFLRQFVDGPQPWDRAIRKYPEHDWLGLEAETRRGNAPSPYAASAGDDTRVVATSAPLGIHTFRTGVAPTEWRALDAFSALAEPSREQRILRMKLAADLARVAAVVGFEAKAIKWVDMLAADAVALRDERVGPYDHPAKLEPYTIERIEILRSFVHLRVALNHAEPRISRGTLPKRLGVAYRTHDVDTQRARYELDAILAYVDTGDLEGLTTPAGFRATSFTNHLATTNFVFAGLDKAKSGSGADLVKWLDTVSPSIALPVALLASRRITSERDVMLTWLVNRSVRDFAKDQPTDSLYERAAIAYMRAGIAENLQAHVLAQEFRDQSSRILYALTRRDTSLTIALTRAWE